MKRLIVFSGIPGSGKSTLSKKYANDIDAIWLSIDPIEGEMKLSGVKNDHKLGVAAYNVMKVIAGQQLGIGKAVVIDAVNPVEGARDIWRQLAKQFSVHLEIVECVTKDRSLHKQRIDKRVRNIPGMKEISWDRVKARESEYQPWRDERIVINTDGTFDETYEELVTELSYKQS